MFEFSWIALACFTSMGKSIWHCPYSSHSLLFHAIHLPFWEPTIYQISMSFGWQESHHHPMHFRTFSAVSHPVCLISSLELPSLPSQDQKSTFEGTCRRAPVYCHLVFDFCDQLSTSGTNSCDQMPLLRAPRTLKIWMTCLVTKQPQQTYSNNRGGKRVGNCGFWFLVNWKAGVVGGYWQCGKWTSLLNLVICILFSIFQIWCIPLWWRPTKPSESHNWSPPLLCPHLPTAEQCTVSLNF